jgi:hypothetical protein
MTKKTWLAAVMVLAGFGAVGFGLLAAQEFIPRQRVSPKLLKEALAQPPIVTATAPHSIGRIVQDLRAVADDLEKGGNKSDSTRLRGIIGEIVRRAENDVADKKAQVTRLNAELEDLKSAVGQ